MLTYSSQQLRSVRHAGCRLRRVDRKSIFTHRLWRPSTCVDCLPGDVTATPTGVRSADFVDKHETTSDNTTPCDASSPCLNVGWQNVRSLTSKTHCVRELIDDNRLDAIVLSETWHHSSDDICLRHATPPGYTCVDAVRQSDPGHGGLAVIYRQHYQCTKMSTTPSTNTFEKICLRFDAAGRSVILLSVYRPGSQRPTSEFYQDLASILETLVVQSCPVVVGGDFNIHVDDPADPDAIKLAELLSSFGVTQHVTSATHQAGHTLDLVIAGPDVTVHDVKVGPPGSISDHSVVTCHIPVQLHVAPRPLRLVRSWRHVDRQQFADAIRNSPLAVPPQSATAEELFNTYHRVLRDLADRFAPVHRVRSYHRPLTPWFDAECTRQRRRCRVLERRYRRTQSSSDRSAWVTALRDKHAMLKSKQRMYWLGRIAAAEGNSSKLWRSLSGVLHRDKHTSDPTTNTRLSADDLLNFFNDKVETVRANTGGATVTEDLPPASSTLDSLTSYSEEEVRRIIMQSPVKSCDLDPIPTFLLRDVIDVLLPFLTAMCNTSLRDGHLPISQRHAIVTPLIKKPSLDRAEMKNYRPVSNVSFMSKVIERMVATQLTGYLQQNDLLPEMQSAYRRGHSTETALLCVISDILRAADAGHVTLLGLLDLSAAFDTVDHDILLSRLRTAYGISGFALAWLGSFLNGRTQEVVFSGVRSAVGQLSCGVPQGSVLGPLLFLLYTAGLFHLVTNHGFRAHSYADDTQVYISVSATDANSASRRFADCLMEIDNWMNCNRLKLNTDKTQIIWLGGRQQLAKLHVGPISVQSASVAALSSVVDLGVHLDEQLSMSEHVSHLSRSCFFQLRQLRVIRRFLTTDAAHTLACAFVGSRLDYCNSLLYGLPDSLINRLQRVQNAAARFVARKRKYDHITPVLRDLHWLPVHLRVKFKVATLVHKCLHGLAPSYLVRQCRPVSSVPGRQQLRSAAANKLDIPRTRTVRFGSRPFSVSGPVVWNSLPSELRRDELSYNQFRSGLKTFLCQQAWTR